MKKFMTALLFVGAISVNGQSPFQYNQTDRYYPKTPETAAFEKFINIPPGNYTGVHGFSVPIYTIQADEFSFPISIDYHGGGVKVDEISSNVGLGWNLNVGGINLSQEVRGLVDDENAEFDIDPLTFDPNGNDYLTAMNMVGNVLTILMGCPVLMPGADSKSEQNPDYFSYSLLNNSGRFIIDSETKYHTIPKDDVNILNYTKFIDNKGIQYQFSRYVLSHNTYGAFNNWLSYAFKIDEIKFPKGNSMIFTYVQVPYKYLSNYEVTQKIPADGGAPRLIEGVPTRTNVTEHLVESIEYMSTIVKFLYLRDQNNNIIAREDVNGGARLEKIQIYYKSGQGNLTLRKEFKINTSYFESTGSNPDIFSNDDYPIENLSKRLKLESVEDLINETKYEFEYIEGTESDKKLPSRFSYATDYWGVYNGPNHKGPIETFTFKPKNSNREEVVWGANKNPDSLYAQIGVLKRIKLPTGGYQEFFYELDEYRNEEFLDGEFPETILYPREYYTPYKHTGESDFYHDIELPIEAPDYRDGLDYRIDYDTNALAYGYDGSSENTPLGQYYYFQIFEDGQALPEKYILKQGFYERLLDKFQLGKEYKIKLFTDGTSHHNFPQPPNIYVRLHLTWAQKEYHYLKNKNTGNLRTKSIMLYDSDNSPKIKKSFKYHNFENNNFSGGTFTGRSLYKPFYSYIDTTPPFFPGCAPQYTKHRVLFRSPTYLNLGTSYGKSVYYSNVTEIYENKLSPDETYKKEVEYNLPSWTGYPVESDYLFYWPHNEYEGGKVKNEKLYDNLGNKIKTITNFYEKDYHFNTESSNYLLDRLYALNFGLNVTINEAGICFSGGEEGCVPLYFFATNYYYITSAWVKPIKTITEDWKNGVKIMSDSIQYQYSPTYAHINPVSITKTNSLGQVVKTDYEYNHPYKKSEPTTVKTYENGAALSVQQTTFQSAGLPQYVFAKKGASTLDNVPPSEDLKVTYDSYDAQGNLTQYTTEDGIPVSVIWGYNGQYPIAKVEGAAYNTLSSYISVLQPASNNGTLTAANFETLRNLSGAIVTSYIYKPLIGVTSIIHPNGQVEYYEYDASGRLKEVYIMEGTNKRILKAMDYHYKP